MAVEDRARPKSAMMSGRIQGLDVARAIALIGMVAAHVGDDGASGRDLDGWAWLQVAHGRPSALFAVLAGVSISLMLVRRAGGDWRDATDLDVTHTRWRVAVRGAILIVAGYLLNLLAVPVDIILTNLGLMFLLALPALRWSNRALLLTAAAALAVGAALARNLAAGSVRWGLLDAPVLEKLWSYHYPAVAWMAYIFAGMVIGRLALRAARVQIWLAGGGAALAIVAYGTGYLLKRSGLGGPGAIPWFDVTSHSYSAFEMAGNLGTAALVIGACLAATMRWPRTLWPLAATGSMAFTLYVAHIIVIDLVGNEMMWDPSNVAMCVLVAGLIAFACLWKWRLGQGPLERLMSTASTRVADSVERAQVATAR